MTTITKERIELFIKSPLENGLTRGEQIELARIALASLESEPVSQPYKLPEEKGASLQLRNLIRKRHAEWSDSTFGNVGPVGPLKHLSKEALEAAAEPGDLSEWADMQFLLWDAQRRAGISDGEITAAMEEKLKVNMARQWPEPKDGEPRLHIKEQPVPVVPAEMPKGLAGQIVSLLAHNIGDKFLAQKIWNACRAAMLQGSQPVSNCDELQVIGWLRSDYNSDDKRDPDAPLFMLGSNNPSETWGVKYMPLTGNSPVTPDGWISCSERMPAQDDWVLIYSKHGEYLAGQVQGEYVELNDGTLSWLGSALHWMLLPEPPQQEVK
ncbi:DUF550 domain-containing protein [Salmonella enterica]|uniref:DUF550 domain-containing protein n=1 Tax=Salmonella enterica subsp. enterica serovar Javiana TaxID=363569 RepID=A0A736LNW3_SALET|nr:DUF550 domain-containing protein [Salmonella enterica subsp. enterica serovar Javiana]EAN0513162.1 DUF550 domain-containing protein [Salmonella enterica]EBU8024913.1 DUF550 domain-containing protein [Salmonella enterica subsp. enterica serovar Saintpaul]ECD2762874.1 DUF550 domain-containing protein [Salmonella enterica subsp. enterica serovar Agona]ECE5832779.1 DUF550 domain-containing protein [Salmonella enterica subsp. enterica]ECU5733244.1 DUF550 domain-containing protein [Salmonella ent